MDAEKNPDPLLELTGVHVARGGQDVLHGIDLTIAAGSFVALVGPSGSGKTTLLKSLNRLAVPNAGAIRLGGEETARMDSRRLRRRIGYVFQEHALFPHMSVAENIALPLRLAGRDRAARGARVTELLDLVALPRDFAARMPVALSGGQAQRVGVARALATSPELMLLDEPFAALDPVVRSELGRAYRALHEDLGLTTILVTHDMAEALLLADRIVVLIDGRLRADAAPAELIRHADAQVAALLAAPLAQARALAALA
jgi:osmoprotectant transport system ATP-binding protein